MNGNTGINGLLAIQHGFYNQLLGEKSPEKPNFKKEIEDHIIRDQSQLDVIRFLSFIMMFSLPLLCNKLLF